jgi:hypothetical protein
LAVKIPSILLFIGVLKANTDTLEKKRGGSRMPDGLARRLPEAAPRELLALKLEKWCKIRL